MKILVYSKNPLTELEKTRVKDIIRQSHCPNESLKNTFNRFAFMQGDSIIYFDDVTVQNRHTALCTELKAWWYMYEQFKAFFIKHRYIIIGVILFVAVCAALVFCFRKDVSNNGEPINSIRNELDHATDAEQGITGTVEEIRDTSSDLADTIGTAQETSSGFDAIIEQCKSIIEQIRNQPAE